MPRVVVNRAVAATDDDLSIVVNDDDPTFCLGAPGVPKHVIEQLTPRTLTFS